MTKEQLREMIGETVEEKLIELLGDPDEGLTVKRALRARLLRQRRKVASGERGESLSDVARKLGLH
jgi:predicted Zn-ribbon and HTH transcriptional regulator